MGWFTGLRIRNKLIVIILAVSLIVVGIIGAVRIAWDIEQGRKSLLQESSALLQLIGDRSSAALIFEDTRLAKENLSSLQKIPNIVDACIYRKDNTLLALYQRDAQSQSPCEVTANYKSDIKKHWFGKELLHISTPIYQGQTILGWIYLTSDFSIINMQLQDQLIFSLLALFSAILISVLLANWAQQLISRPHQRNNPNRSGNRRNQ